MTLLGPCQTDPPARKVLWMSSRRPSGSVCALLTHSGFGITGAAVSLLLRVDERPKQKTLGLTE